jgi:hypothetical protein
MFYLLHVLKELSWSGAGISILGFLLSAKRAYNAPLLLSFLSYCFIFFSRRYLIFVHPTKHHPHLIPASFGSMSDGSSPIDVASPWSAGIFIRLFPVVDIFVYLWCALGFQALYSRVFKNRLQSSPNGTLTLNQGNAVNATLYAIFSYA